MKRFLVLFLVISTLCSALGCTGTQKKTEESSRNMTFSEEELPKNPALPDILHPEASGILTEETGRAVIDYSNTADGYVMVRVKEETEHRLKVQVKGPSATYTYNVTAGEWETFPLSDGDGSYQVTLLENVEGNKYALMQSVSAEVILTDEFAPFLRPNQYVDYGMRN